MKGFVKRAFSNLLSGTASFFFIFSILLFLPTWGGSLRFLGYALIYSLLALLFRRKTNRTKNKIGILALSFTLLFFLYSSRSIEVHVIGEPTNIYILTDVPNAPEIHSHFQLKKKLKIDSTYILKTSSSVKDIDLKIKVINELGNKIGSTGTVYRYGKCQDAAALVSIQTIYLFDSTKEEKPSQHIYSSLLSEQAQLCSSLLNQ
ncbi:hypothetical protein OB69_10905 [Roseivirga seohaensis subsp. aquiponti]|uniref:Uncharacterized protein n=1 Tax=Roseivirga seohaensis subsp. aquiponti TaxID=1566026 RepID=A0A0L8AK19_9BACT|nr:hypothetical protein [Roseivirga seohaensis]KOF02798.1 hypothetical protein OB69_10905 [Roseivirga seohaensis subsp. aquiponti]